MKIGIFTYGTRGDVQPYLPIAIELKKRGHEVIVHAPENFSSLFLNHQIDFIGLSGNAQKIMQSSDADNILSSENSIKLMKYFFQVISNMKEDLFQDYYNSINKVDVIFANYATIPFTYPIAEALNKKIALNYFMPPMAKTSKFSAPGFEKINLPFLNKISYEITYFFYWKFVKSLTNYVYRQMNLPELKTNIIHHINSKKILDLYNFSPTLISTPSDWEPNHQITGFITNIDLKENNSELQNWISNGKSPIYVGFGSNKYGKITKIENILLDLLTKNERILLVKGWNIYKNLPNHPNLFICNEVDHNIILPQCKLAIFHGGAGTLHSILKAKIPMIIISLYTDQPYWGNLIEKMKLGVHIRFKNLSLNTIKKALEDLNSKEIQKNILTISNQISLENGTEKTIEYLEKYFEK